MENDGWLQFNGIRRDSKGYLAQQIEAYMKQVNLNGNGNGKRKL